MKFNSRHPSESTRVRPPQRATRPRLNAPLTFVCVRGGPSAAVRSVTAQRLLVSAPEDVVPALALRLYRAYWRDDEDVADAAVLGRIAAEFGLDLSAAEAAPAKDGLRRNTQEAFERGAFGVPAFWVEGARNGYAAPGEPGRLFWGQDRLHFALHAAGLPRELCEPPQLVEDARLGAGRALTFYHDFSSPWSYLASLRVREVAAASGATVKFVPILLGALFRAIGTHNTPVVTCVRRCSSVCLLLLAHVGARGSQNERGEAQLRHA